MPNTTAGAAGQRSVEHRTVIAAPARDIYALLADVTRWPEFFAPTVHAEQLSLAGGTERIRLWATANGQLKAWTSRRDLDPDALRIGFRQEVPAPPVGSMSGEWRITPSGEGHSEVLLTHTFAAAGDDLAELDWIDRAVDRNSTAELAALRARAELGGTLEEIRFTLADSLWIRAAAREAYDFIARAEHWPERLPHVERLELTEDTPGLQWMEMDTKGPDGSVHTTASGRVCLPDRIVYKQVTTPALMTTHVGEWLLESNDGGVLATSRHTVVLRTDAIAEVLGPDATTAAAREFVSGALSANSSATLRQAKEHAERLGV